MDLSSIIEIPNFSQEAEAVINTIELRVADLMDTDMNLLMSYLYRLDVEERDLHIAFLPDSHESVAHKLAVLIYQRQKERTEHKKNTFVPPITDPDYL
ncbi:MAG: hypothetical protein KDC04_00505 [Saprospiraceae bacterium]|nr:hypothetical protein [Saprospiraceae bacterium]